MEEYKMEDILRVYDTLKLYGYDNIHLDTFMDYGIFFSRAAIPKKQPSTLKNGLPVNWDNEEV